MINEVSVGHSAALTTLGAGDSRLEGVGLSRRLRDIMANASIRIIGRVACGVLVRVAPNPPGLGAE